MLRLLNTQRKTLKSIAENPLTAAIVKLRARKHNDEPVRFMLRLLNNLTRRLGGGTPTQHYIMAVEAPNRADLLPNFEKPSQL